VTDESGLDRRAALKALLALGAAAPLAGAWARPARASALTSQQLAGRRVIFSYSGLTVPSAMLQQIGPAAAWRAHDVGEADRRGQEPRLGGQLGRDRGGPEPGRRGYERLRDFIDQ
jgi:hypothetical protein